MQSRPLDALALLCERLPALLLERPRLEHLLCCQHFVALAAAGVSAPSPPPARATTPGRHTHICRPSR